MGASRSKHAAERKSASGLLAETVVTPALQTPAARRGLQRQLLKWYEVAGRRLPWRNSQDAYRIWLSEIMLQQTTVAAVIPYFERFLEAFPDVAALAAAPLDDVLRLWEGLGYYSRARNLHRAAAMVVSQHDGQFPADALQLQQLPGIGRYTAGAIASFAFNLPAPIVEANTERLYARLLAMRDDVRSSTGQKQLWSFAESIVSTDRPGDFNQAVMDVGAQICTPARPQCSDCPVHDYCGAFRLGLQDELPRKPPRVAMSAVAELAVIPMRMQRGRPQFLLRRRNAGERWAGMWDAYREESLPEILDSLAVNPLRQQRRSKTRSLFAMEAGKLPTATIERLQQQSGIVAGETTATLLLTYTVTRFKVRLLAAVCAVQQSADALPDGWSWHSLEVLTELPLSKTGRQITNWLQQSGTD